MLIAIHSLYTCLLQHLVYSHAYRNTCASRLRLTSPFTALHKLRLCTSSVCIVFFLNYRKMFINQHTLSHAELSCLAAYLFFFFFFIVRLLSVLRGHSVFSSPPQRPMTSDFEGFLSKLHPLHCCPIFILQKEPVFPFLMFSAKQGIYPRYHFYNVFGMTRSLTGD